MGLTIGVISDTHGLLRPGAVNILKGCDAIIHAGDVGSVEILNELKSLAPTYAVRGNTDSQPYARDLPVYDVIHLDEKFIYVTHILENMDLDPKAAGLDIVVFGHSHTPEIFEKQGVLYINPGSAGPIRFNRPVSMARIITGADSAGEIIYLEK